MVPQGAPHAKRKEQEGYDDNLDDDYDDKKERRRAKVKYVFQDYADVEQSALVKPYDHQSSPADEGLTLHARARALLQVPCSLCSHSNTH